MDTKFTMFRLLGHNEGILTSYHYFLNGKPPLLPPVLHHLILVPCAELFGQEFSVS